MGWDHSDDPQFDRERKQEAAEYEDTHYPGLAEHDEIHGEHGESVREDSGGMVHASERVAHANMVRAAHPGSA